MTDDLATLFAYNRWADARVLEACRSVPADRYAAEVAPGWASLRSTIVHMAGAAQIWAKRFHGETSMKFYEESDLPTLDEAAQLLASAQDRLESLVAGQTPETLEAPFTYRNMRGITASAPLWAALRHVVNHATYHRGQVASKLKQLGVEPPVTDFVFYAIEQTPQTPA
ncbi:DinB family protein [Tundrisphaera lichenicola]|uniref:DinB family protein n=1 Tax=Tundrisphaera lichenicola TaxID=2029860 RepID=UPI003EBF79CB